MSELEFGLTVWVSKHSSDRHHDCQKTQTTQSNANDDCVLVRAEYVDAAIVFRSVAMFVQRVQYLNPKQYPTDAQSSPESD